MKSVDLWLVGFALRCGALLLVEVATFLFVVPTLFNLHNDLANVGAASLAIAAVVAGFLGATSLGREFDRLTIGRVENSSDD